MEKKVLNYIASVVPIGPGRRYTLSIYSTTTLLTPERFFASCALFVKGVRLILLRNKLVSPAFVAGCRKPFADVVVCTFVYEKHATANALFYKIFQGSLFTWYFLL